jgi:hypothetical protein
LLMGTGRVLPSLFVLLAVVFFSGQDILSWMRRNGL